MSLLLMIGLGGLRVVGGGIDRLGAPRRDFQPPFEGAGLHQHRPPLRRALEGQRPARLEVAAPVVQRVQLLRVEEDAAGFVEDQRIRFPGLPEALHHLHELRREAQLWVMRQGPLWVVEAVAIG
ncbi:hypothetical protein JYK14_21690 [Siccirubricoccus sp. KC 17139]|uniref:Secreted protein n=1 Tax=Siccirubricoccus soli TaxID=2899147 RepID=A0ABT1D9Y8_9PROT|nr:hypothetical protein [Siccirubricoccus soli]MCO6418751.1 hypothetical protein [Siccirubricoccus soli]MCP2684886.1 hypothetical protein [Siccirubricoccus soli]